MKNKNGRYLAKKKKKFPMLWFFLILIALLLIGISLITNHKEEPQTILGNDVTESKDDVRARQKQPIWAQLKSPI